MFHAKRLSFYRGYKKSLYVYNKWNKEKVSKYIKSIKTPVTRTKVLEVHISYYVFQPTRDSNLGGHDLDILRKYTEDSTIRKIHWNVIVYAYILTWTSDAYPGKSII